MTDNRLKDPLIDTLQQTELAEGVEVQTRVAGVFPRAIALLIDIPIMFGIFFISIIVIMILFGIISSATMSEGMMKRFIGLVLIYLFLFIWGYNFIFERGVKGGTPGKRIVGLKVVSIDGTRASAKQVFIRNILRAGDILPGAPLYIILGDSLLSQISMGAGIGLLTVGSYGFGMISCLFTKRFQRIGDLVARTVVVHSKVHVHAVAPLPPAAQPKMPRLQIQREEEVAIRSFCERAGIWSVARRAEMAQHADELTAKSGLEGVEELMSYSRWIVERK